LSIIEGIVDEMKSRKKLVLTALCFGVLLVVYNAYYPGTISSMFDVATPYGEGALALALLAFVWVSPFVVIWFFVSGVTKLFASETANEIERRQKGRR
jgi:hypothetical protein